jgi:hypothetical protein
MKPLLVDLKVIGNKILQVAIWNLVLDPTNGKLKVTSLSQTIKK